MKKKIIATITAMVVAAGIGLAFSQSGIVNADPKLSPDDVREKVTAQYPGTIKELELENEKGNPVYEVEVKIENKEYELKVDGNTGEVLKLEEKMVKVNNDKIEKENKNNDTEKDVKITEKASKDDDADDKPKQTIKVETEKVTNGTVKKEVEQAKSNQQTNKVTEEPAKKDTGNQETNKQTPKESNNKKAVIGDAKAKQIALGQFSGTIVEMELDEDDGRLIYEFEIENGNREAEIEIDAYTGKVVVLEIETDDDDD